MEMHFINGWTIVGGRGLWEVSEADRAFRRLAAAKRWCKNNTPKNPTSGLEVVKALAGVPADGEK